MFKKITIQNFRGIKDLTIDDFGKVNLFVGANNSCKTSVLEALYISLAPNNPNLFITTNYIRGLMKARPNLGSTKSIVDAVHNSLKVLFYKLNFQQNIRLESKFQNNEEREIFINPIISRSKDFPELLGSFSSELKEKWEGLDLNWSTNFNGKKKLKFNSKIILSNFDAKVSDDQTASIVGFEPKLSEEYEQKLQKNKLTEKTGRFISYKFVNDLFDIKENGSFDEIVRKKKKSELIEVLKRIEPKIQDIDFTDGFIVDTGLPEMIRLESMGQGTIKLFALACILIADEENIVNGVLLIDEMENGFHFSSQDIIWDFLFYIAEKKKTQIFATTHSMDAVRAFAKVANNKEKNSKKEKSLGKEEKNLDIDLAKLYRIEKYEDESLDVISYKLENVLSSVQRHLEFR